MVAPALIAAGATAIPAIASLFGGSKTYDEPPEIKAARNLLLNFARTGTYGDFTAGAPVDLGYGDYTPTGIENQGLSSLQSLLQGGIPQNFQLGDAALKDTLATDPSSISAQFDPFKKQVEKDTTDQETAQKRSAAFAGNLYSTDTIKNLGKIRSNANDTLTSKLADLTNEFMNRRMQAIPLAYQSGEAQNNVGLSQVAASQQYGDLTRSLNDQSIKARDAETLRRRQELQLPIQAAGQVLGGPSTVPVTSSPYQDLLSTVGQIGGTYLGNQLFTDQYLKRMFPYGTSGGTSGTLNGIPTSSNGSSLYNAG